MVKGTVSFIISVFNGEKYLPDCIRGINKQEYQDYEVIAVNDGSVDKTLDILEDWKRENDRVQVITRSNGGLTSGLNLAISRSKGKYLARHDADDVSSPFRIKEQIEFLQKNPNTVLVSSWAVEFINLNEPTFVYMPPNNHTLISGMLKKGVNPLIHGSIMLRREAFDRLQRGYQFRYCQDYDLYLRLLPLGELHVIPVILYGYRRQASSVTLNSWWTRNYFQKLIMHVNGLVKDSNEKDCIIKVYNELQSLEHVEQYILNNSPYMSTSQVKSQFYISRVGEHMEHRRRVISLRCSLKSIKSAPFWWKSWASLFFCIAGLLKPELIVKWYRGNNVLTKYRQPCFASHISKLLEE